MRIAQYNDSYYPTIDGVVVTVRNYADWLHKYKHNCYIVTVDAGDYENKEPYPVFRYKSIPTILRKEYRIGLTRLDFKTSKMLEERPVDIVHTHSPFGMGQKGLRYAKKHNIPIISTFHTKFYDDFLEETHSKTIAKIMVKRIVNYYNQVDYVWTLNEATANTLREYGYEGKIEIVANGFDDTFLDFPKSELVDIRSKYEIPDDFDIFNFVGRLSKTKNISTILETLALYKKEHSNFVLFITGEGDEEKFFKDLTKKLGLENNVIFTGKVANRGQLISIYTASDIFLFPSVYDNAPLVVREAAACETPCITIKDSGASQNIIDKKNGFICENTPESVCETIKLALADKKQLKIIGEKAKTTIAKPWSVILKDVEKRYEQIIKEHKEKIMTK